ncbi:MAG: hypothetical protein LBT82_00305 [Oscillospiraceae bacterium]|jgi:hypothetical protein|nr:hypothetical protein [Oscillospiraceae bacterium]
MSIHKIKEIIEKDKKTLHRTGHFIRRLISIIFLKRRIMKKIKHKRKNAIIDILSASAFVLFLIVFVAVVEASER